MTLGKLGSLRYSVSGVSECDSRFLIETYERSIRVIVSSREGGSRGLMPMSVGYRGFGQGGPHADLKLHSVMEASGAGYGRALEKLLDSAGVAALTTVVPGDSVRSGMAR